MRPEAMQSSPFAYSSHIAIFKRDDDSDFGVSLATLSRGLSIPLCGK